MLEVKLLSHSPDPLRSLYVAYRTAYSALTPQQIVERIDADKITEERMLEFIEERLKTGHASPLQQVYFEFAISGVSRAFSHQFVRHHVGIDIEQQSQRYVIFKNGEFPFTTPPSVAKASAEGKDGLSVFHTAMRAAREAYAALIAMGIPSEDARFVLPNATNTNLKVTVNFLELQHIADQRLCTRAQWEFRYAMGKMRGEVMRAYPWLGRYIGPKCMAFRLGYCDESFADWQGCPFSKTRPHKSQVVPK